MFYFVLFCIVMFQWWIVGRISGGRYPLFCFWTVNAFELRCMVGTSFSTKNDWIRPCVFKVVKPVTFASVEFYYTELQKKGSNNIKQY